MSQWILPLIFFNAALLTFLAHPDTKMPVWLNAILHAASAGIAAMLARLQPNRDDSEEKKDPPVK